MTREELAAQLNGREYRDEITRAEENAARKSGLVVAFGASDDLLEFRGCIDAEIGVWGGDGVAISAKGLFPTEHDLIVLKRYGFDVNLRTVRAEWCPDGSDISWRISIDIPHSTFMVNEDGEPYCQGIVFSMVDLAGEAPQE